MLLEIRHLRLIAAIVDAGGVTRASDRLYLTQSALSHQLRELETQLGTRLFLRVGRQMVLTLAGERVLAVARSVLRELHAAEADVVSENGTRPRGLLRLATQCYPCYHWLPVVIAEFRQHSPGVEIRVVPEVTRCPMPALLVGELDLAIVTHPPGEKPEGASKKVELSPLFEDEMVAVVSPSHPLSGREYLRPSDLAGEHLLLYNAPAGQSTLLEDVLRSAAVRPASTSRIEFTDAIIALVKAGLGVSVLPRWALISPMRDGSVVPIRVTPKGLYRQWTAAHRVGGDADGYLRGFIDHLVRAFVTRNDSRDRMP
ncbi:MAG: LysR family transcriptional regulator [Gemmatimonadota bacterium]|nr:LysR family transcriptional regulator [Gemmatimonadota bacterium]